MEKMPEANENEGQQWKEIVEKYTTGFENFAQVSRELNEGVSFVKGEVPEALKKLRDTLKSDDFQAIKGVLGMIEEK